MPIDASDQFYEEVKIPDGFVRVTFIKQRLTKQPSIRIQVREESGHLRQGPEIPIAILGNLVDAAIRLLRGMSNWDDK